MMGSKGSRTRAHSLRRALVHALLVVFFAQGVVVQSHVHSLSQTAQAQAEAAKNTVKYSAFDARVAERKAPLPVHHDADDCPMCVHAAFAGAFLGAGPNAIAPPVELVSQAVFADAPQLGRRVLALGWQSRAPPSV